MLEFMRLRGRLPAQLKGSDDSTRKKGCDRRASGLSRCCRVVEAMIDRWVKNPITRKRITRFKSVRRAYVSFWLMMILYLLSLGSELICNNNPLYLRLAGRSYFPVFRFYPENRFVEGGRSTRPDYKKLNQLPRFKNDDDNYMIFPPIPFGPFESVAPGSIAVADHVTAVFKPMPLVGTVNIKVDGTIERAASFEPFVPGEETGLKGKRIGMFFDLPETISKAVQARFANQERGRISEEVAGPDGTVFRVSLSAFRKRRRAPRTVRITFREATPAVTGEVRVAFNRDRQIVKPDSDPEHREFWQQVAGPDREWVEQQVETRFLGPVDAAFIVVENRRHQVVFSKKEVRFPFQPTQGHLMGVDGAGRDVFARIVYGFRTSLSFGLLLVACSMALGIVAGALQGYYGGFLDITSQRFIEIWSALPFLYIMILMGSVYGRSFSLLLFCYGLFNWIGISYYIRAEFLRLRRQSFVEASTCMGVSTNKIIFKHILPNALVPVITFFPFSLVGAIGALAALDYLGFGLPPPTPSWGELLFQAQQYRWAWWLILYPSLALFTVMLLGVFVGEGIRNAYDPKQYTRLE